MSAQMAYWERQLSEAEEEIARLTKAGLEAAYGETMKADELEHWIATCDRLSAECDDLAAKLAEAQAELHDLRIRVGLGEEELWSCQSRYHATV